MGQCARKLNIYQVELTSFCDMKCSYCPHPTMKRGKGHMSAETLARCIDLAKATRQPRLVMHHFGEPLLHPKLKERLDQVADAGLPIQFSTNGLLLEKKWHILLSVKAPIAITLSMHQWADEHPRVYLEALHAWQKKAWGTNVTFLKAFNVRDGEENYRLHKWDKGDDTPWDYYNDCFFLKDNWGVVLWNGDVVSCCVDVEGENVIGNVHNDDALFLQSKSWRACDTCDVLGEASKARNKAIKSSLYEPAEPMRSFRRITPDSGVKLGEFIITWDKLS